MSYKCKVCGLAVETAEHCGQPCEYVAEPSKPVEAPAHAAPQPAPQPAQ